MLEQYLNSRMYYGYEVAGLGFQPGSKVVKTHDLAENHQWYSLNRDTGIKERVSARRAIKSTGIEERRWAGKNEDVISLAVAASKQAFARQLATGAAIPTIDRVRLVFVNTSSPDVPLPGLGPRIAEQLGILNAEVYDVRQACAALPYMLNAAIPMLDGNKYTEGDEALIISTDDLLKVTDLDDYDTASLFAAAAGALVLRKTRTRRLAYMQLNSFGKLAPLIDIKPDKSTIDMDGLGVYTAVSEKVPEVADIFFANTKLSMKGMDFVTIHQASGKVVEKLRIKLGVPERKTLNILREYGNSSAAAMIGVLKKAAEEKKLGRTLLVAFGAGIQIGVGVIEFPKEKRRFAKLRELMERFTDAVRRPFRMIGSSIPFSQFHLAEVPIPISEDIPQD